MPLNPCTSNVSFHRVQEYIPPDKLAEVRRVLYGCNNGKPIEPLALPAGTAAAAAASNFDLQGYAIAGAPEQLRPPNVVRIGLVQHQVVTPTTAPFAEQRQVSGCLLNDGRWAQ